MADGFELSKHEKKKINNDKGENFTARDTDDKMRSGVGGASTTATKKKPIINLPPGRVQYFMETTSKPHCALNDIPYNDFPLQPSRGLVRAAKTAENKENRTLAKNEGVLEQYDSIHKEEGKKHSSQKLKNTAGDLHSPESEDATELVRVGSAPTSPPVQSDRRFSMTATKLNWEDEAAEQEHASR